MKSVDIHFIKNNSNNINIIDIRNREKSNDNHILNAINIPKNELLVKYSQVLKKDCSYFIYCQRGINRKKICKFLSTLGYIVINIEGGYEAWIITE